MIIRNENPKQNKTKISFPLEPEGQKFSITLAFGSEVSGIDKIRSELEKNLDLNRFVRIPMNDKHIRSFNLANSVSIVMFECFRQFCNRK
jgi:tRNA(Leu) C34 or U34 (ribose-2'-O)-methylase TrmL